MNRDFRASRGRFSRPRAAIMAVLILCGASGAGALGAEVGLQDRGYQSLDEALGDWPGIQSRDIQGFNSYVFVWGVAF